MKVVVQPAAVEDIPLARDYDENARPGLGEGLADGLDQLFARLELFPRSAPGVAGYESVRRARLRRFPYAVFYRVTAGTVHVLRVIHTARSPDTWPR